MEKSNTLTGSWWLHNNRLHQSKWLQSTLSDLEKKVRKILSLVEDDGDTFAKRADMFYQNRPLLIESIKDLYGSYKSLAEDYEQLVINPFSKRKNLDKVSPELKGQNSDSKNEEWQFVDQDQVAKEQQAELNDKMREAIDELHARINKLVAENVELQSELSRMRASAKADTLKHDEMKSKVSTLDRKESILKRILGAK